jgi:hypothetical protein
MKLRIDFNAPGEAADAINRANLSEADSQAMYDLTSRFCPGGDSIAIEFDTEAQTATVIPWKRK